MKRAPKGAFFFWRKGICRAKCRPLRKGEFAPQTRLACRGAVPVMPRCPLAPGGASLFVSYLPSLSKANSLACQSFSRAMLRSPTSALSFWKAAQSGVPELIQARFHTAFSGLRAGRFVRCQCSRYRGLNFQQKPLEKERTFVL